MSLRRLVVAALLLSLSVVVPAEARPPKPDQKCDAAERGGYVGERLSQSFTPKAATIGRVDVLIGSTKTGPRELRFLLVGHRTLPGGVVVRTGVLAEAVKRVPLAAFRPSWASWRLPKPVAATAGGPLAERVAVEVQFPDQNESIFWVWCGSYAQGQASVGVDPAHEAAGQDSSQEVGAQVPHDLAFREYATNR